MTRHCYSAKSLAGDYLRAGFGLAITGGPLLFLPTATPVAVVLFGIGALFGIFGLRTVARQFTVIEMSDQGIRVVRKGEKRLAWQDIRHLRLDHYSTRRDRQGGWMQIKVSGPKGHIRVDSTVDDFHLLATQIARGAIEHGVEMSNDTRGNFFAMGIDLPRQNPEERS